MGGSCESVIATSDRATNIKKTNNDLNVGWSYSGTCANLTNARTVTVIATTICTRALP